MVNKIVLIGGGGHCKSVIDTALRMREFAEIVITDSNIPQGTRILGCEVVGTDDCLPKLKENGFESAFITVGSVKNDNSRSIIADKLEKLGFSFPHIIDPSSIVSTSANIGDGTFIGKGVVVNSSCEIGKFCIINTGSIVEHECYVGDFSHISVGTILCGEVRVGKNCMIGAGSTIIQGVSIGDNTLIGANSTVLGNVLSDRVRYGIVKSE